MSVIVRNQSELASQPLLLLMLALYDAESNALSRLTHDDSDRPIDESTLYERLLSAFAEREIAKVSKAFEIKQLVESELQQLSLIALGMMNRRRQWITEQELDDDLFARPRARQSYCQGLPPADDESPSRVGPLLLYSTGSSRSGRRAAADLRVSACDVWRVPRSAAGGSTRRQAGQSATSFISGINSCRGRPSLLSFLIPPLSSRQQLRFVRGCVDRIAQDGKSRDSQTAANYGSRPK